MGSFEEVVKDLKTFCQTCLAEHPYLDEWEVMAYRDDLEIIDRWLRDHNDGDGFVLMTLLLTQVQQVAKSMKHKLANDPSFIYAKAAATFGDEFYLYYEALQEKHGEQWAFEQKVKRTRRLISRARTQEIPIPRRLQGRKEFGT